MTNAAPTRLLVTEAHVLRLKRSCRLRFDTVRELRTLLAPERVVVLNETSEMILKALDGRSLGEIVDAFARDFNAPRALIAGDVLKMAQDFADKGYLEVR